ncbi:MAG: T9SS type A sorting domain-containing protein [Flavobacteriales bacterium]|jgi:hypothetical protein|nr:T9SS type A sorting domain-containing protein [Flavobacteriales bacterium]
MKKHLLAFALIATTLLGAAQTAPNYTGADCAGNPHDLYAELDAGKVLVLMWVMPCPPCVGPSLTTYNVVQSYQSSHPDRVRMYLCDDYANTSCAALNGWKNINGLTNATTFSDPSLVMTNYGTPAMPKMMVLGGTDHATYYSAKVTVDPNTLQSAINAALAATSIGEPNALVSDVSIHPVPATDQAWIDITLSRTTELMIDLHDLSGKAVQRIHNGPLPPGTQRIELTTLTIPAGMYVVRITDGTELTYRHLIITH